MAEEGKKYNVDSKSMVISNTHDYMENGKHVEIKDVVDYLDGMCFTVHSDTPEAHDDFNKDLTALWHL